jgi:ADP-heptose:LPS heptosyltransferase
VTHPKKILLIRWKSIGDVVFTLPAFRCVRANFPDSHITYMTSIEYAPLIEGFSGADEIFSIDRGLLKQFWKSRWPGEVNKLCRGIIGACYDLVVDFQGYWETAWLSWLSGAPERWGVVYRPSRARAYTCAVDRPPDLHPVDAHLQFLARCGLKMDQPENDFVLPEEKRLAAEKLFQEFGLNPHLQTVFIQPFTSSPQKDWPLEKWLELARRLHDLKIQVLFGGGPADRLRLETAMREQFPVAAGTDLLTSCSLATRCALVIGSDTGLLHMATASGCRVILIEDTPEGHKCPYGHPDWSIAPSRAHSRVADIDLETVLAATRRVIGT